MFSKCLLSSYLALSLWRALSEAGLYLTRRCEQATICPLFIWQNFTVVKLDCAPCSVGKLFQPIMLNFHTAQRLQTANANRRCELMDVQNSKLNSKQICTYHSLIFTPGLKTLYIHEDIPENLPNEIINSSDLQTRTFSHYI